MNDDIKSQPGFCYEIFKNQAFWSNKKSICYNPCSYFSGFIAKDKQPEEVWYGPEHKSIIEKIKKGDLIEGCKRCYHEEYNGIKSRRQGSKELYEEYLFDTDISQTKSPVALDYSIGNLCNLKCTICGPDNSAKWISDWKKLYPDVDVSDFHYVKNHYIQINDPEYLKNIRSIHFHGGGDPLLANDHIKLLENVEQVRGLSDVKVFYNINATNRVDDRVLELWSRCQIVELYFSIDDIGERFEYQRTGARWLDTLDTIQWFYKNMPVNHLFKINCTWGYLNLYYLDELWMWYKENFTQNRLGDPVNFIFQKCNGTYSLDWVSANTMAVLKDKFTSIPELQKILLLLETNECPHDEFWDIIKRTDKIRNTNFNQLCPEWSKLL